MDIDQLITCIETAFARQATKIVEEIREHEKKAAERHDELVLLLNRLTPEECKKLRQALSAKAKYLLGVAWPDNEKPHGARPPRTVPFGPIGEADIDDALAQAQRIIPRVTRQLVAVELTAVVNNWRTGILSKERTGEENKTFDAFLEKMTPSTCIPAGEAANFRGAKLGEAGCPPGVVIAGLVKLFKDDADVPLKADIARAVALKATATTTTGEQEQTSALPQPQLVAWAREVLADKELGRRLGQYLAGHQPVVAPKAAAKAAAKAAKAAAGKTRSAEKETDGDPQSQKKPRLEVGVADLCDALKKRSGVPGQNPDQPVNHTKVNAGSGSAQEEALVVRDQVRAAVHCQRCGVFAPSNIEALLAAVPNPCHPVRAEGQDVGLLTGTRWLAAVGAV
ncbi:hypothetical protein PAPYR_6676 [Paratrimastix pyriformis]|uniref:DUF222 domain-containing protein n=1 Tax=Paratrimastix pyriformis TaxID=342808 RepID=A0ABQ8UH77_9EUKA|nr:hypothetical protein PAPYR_6676 [Paratrimastix pyriformis]